MKAPRVESIYIRSSSKRSVPSPPHVVYHIEVQLEGGRAYTVYKRYSEFVDLHVEMEQQGNESPPAKLPPKHAWSIFTRTNSEDERINERKTGLELYLRTLLSAKDARWRESRSFLSFLEVPLTKGEVSFTVASWLDEYSVLSSHIKELYALLSKRDALLSSGASQEGRQAGVDVKLGLASAVASLSKLARGLDDLAKTGAMPEGEIRRRSNLMTKLQGEVEALNHAPKPATPAPSAISSTKKESSAAEEARQMLLGQHKPAGRVLGAARSKPGQETDLTRPLDNQQLLQYQQETIDAQDDRLSQISAILRRQRMLGQEIHNELVGQNELLDGLDTQVDQTASKMSSARTKLKKLGT